MRSDFAAFILTHGRPNKVVTISSLRRAGYTGKIFIVVDDEDSTIEQYKELFGDSVLVFSKDEIAKTTDQFDNFKDRRAILWARNACFDLAKEVGCKYFIQLDDDYTNFSYRRPGRLNGTYGWHGWTIKSLDDVLTAFIGFMEETPTLTIAMSQGGDHIGGPLRANGKPKKQIKRKAMNSFICDVDRPFQFSGRINEDVNTYVGLGRVGRLFFTYLPVQLNQMASQSNSGGMTELYLDSGTYVKSFYTIMVAPSCVTIAPMGMKNRRLHHRIDWGKAVPMIISESFAP